VQSKALTFIFRAYHKVAAMNPPHHALFQRAHFILSLTLVLLTPSCARQRHNTVEKYYQEAAQSADAHDFKKALGLAQKAAALEPSPRALAFKATLLYQNGKLQESKKTFELALQQKNISPLIKTTILNNYAAVLVPLGERKKAKQIWQELVNNKFYTTPEVAWVNLGLLAWEESKRHKKNLQQSRQEELNALHCFAKAISLEPTYVDAYFFRAQIFMRQKRNIEAVQALKKVVALAPAHAQAKKMLQRIVPSKPIPK